MYVPLGQRADDRDLTDADVDGDQLPDVAVGDVTPTELSAVVRKIIRYERQADEGAWRRRVDVGGGVGGFGGGTDMLIEAVDEVCFRSGRRQGMQRRGDANPADVGKQMQEGCLAWINSGTGCRQNDSVETPTGRRPILAVNDVPQLRCGRAGPLAVLVACYTGAIDARSDCLGEELTLSETGPVAVRSRRRGSPCRTRDGTPCSAASCCGRHLRSGRQLGDL